LQRASQLSNVLKEIARSEKFANFDIFYMDFPLRQSKLLFSCLSHEAFGEVLLTHCLYFSAVLGEGQHSQPA